MMTGIDICGVRNALILAPHPDDEVLGCAGTVLQLNRRGGASTTVFVTDGERLHGDPSAEVGSARRDEARQAAELMGCRGPLFLGMEDGGLSNASAALIGELKRIIASEGPDLVFAPSPMDYHHDHIATASAALQVFRALPTFALAFYEIYGAIRFNCLVDITSAEEEKKKLILTYRTSLFGTPEIYARAALGLNAHRSLFLRTTGSYEAFWVLTEPMTDRDILAWLCYGIST